VSDGPSPKRPETTRARHRRAGGNRQSLSRHGYYPELKQNTSPPTAEKDQPSTTVTGRTCSDVMIHYLLNSACSSMLCKPRLILISNLRCRRCPSILSFQLNHYHRCCRYPPKSSANVEQSPIEHTEARGFPQPQHQHSTTGIEVRHIPNKPTPSPSVSDSHPHSPSSGSSPDSDSSDDHNSAAPQLDRHKH
jgi:hypothetical protein